MPGRTRTTPNSPRATYSRSSICRLAWSRRISPPRPPSRIWWFRGGLTTGLLHALVAMDLPGPGTVFLNQSFQFIAPVFIGDTITAEAEVLKVHATKPVTTLKITIARQTGDTVLEGEAVCYTMIPE